MQVELAFVGAFVKRGKRDRCGQILSNPHLRHKLIHQLAPSTEFDPRYRVPIPSHKLFVENTAVELRKRHSPHVVYVISEDPALDQTAIPLVDALQQVVGRGIVTILACVPARLAFVEAEDERFILEREDPQEGCEFVRFVVGRKDVQSHVEQGIFQAVGEALDSQQVTGSDAKELKELEDWFAKNLERPTAFGRDKLRLWHLLVQDGRHRAHLAHLEDGQDPRTQWCLRQEDQNRPARLCGVRGRMATGSRAFPKGHAAA